MKRRFKVRLVGEFLHRTTHLLSGYVFTNNADLRSLSVRDRAVLRDVKNEGVRDDMADVVVNSRFNVDA